MSKNHLRSIMDYLDSKRANLLVDAGFIISEEMMDELKSYGFKVVDIRFINTVNKLTTIIKTKKEHERGISPLIIITSWRDMGDSKYLNDRMNVVIVSGETEIGDAIKMSEECSDYRCWFEITSKIAKWKSGCEDLEMRKHISSLLEEHVDENFQKFIVENFPDVVSSPELCVHTIWNHIKEDKVLLIIMDGMALDDWYVISHMFEYEEKHLFALIPTLTAISRPAAASGKLPRDYNRKTEKSLVVEVGGIYINGDTHRLLREIKELQHGKIVFICRYPDELMHVELQGKTSMYAKFRDYLKDNLLNIISQAIKFGWAVYLSADHGNIECWNNYSKKIPQYADKDGSRCLEIPGENSLPEELNEMVITISSNTFGYLEEGKYYALPKKRISFTKKRFAVTHGGITPEELVVPLIRIVGVKQ